MDIVKKRQQKQEIRAFNILKNVLNGLPLNTNQIGRYNKVKIIAPKKKFYGYEQETQNIGEFDVKNQEIDFSSVKDFMEKELLSERMQFHMNTQPQYQDFDYDEKHND